MRGRACTREKVRRPLVRFPITWNRVIEKESLKFKEVEHVLIEKVAQLFRDMR